MQELTRYLSNIMSSVLLGLPPPIKELIYFDSLSHISSSLLSLPLDQSIRRISPQAVTAYRLDVDHLVEFVNGLDDKTLLAGLDELRQTVELMSAAAVPGGRAEEEFFDAEKGRKRFGRVDRASGAEMLEKYVVHHSSIFMCSSKTRAGFLTVSSSGYLKGYRQQRRRTRLVLQPPIIRMRRRRRRRV